MTTDAEKTLIATFGWNEIRMASLPRRVLATFATYWQVRQTRRNLADLSDDQLRDIGVTQAEAKRELGKSWYWS